MCVELLVLFPYYPLDACGICNDISCSIFNIGKFCFSVFFSLCVVIFFYLEVCFVCFFFSSSFRFLPSNDDNAELKIC